MRRTDKEITSRSEIDEIIHGGEVCHLAFAVDGEPYVVPVSFGYDGDSLYFYTAINGKKIDCIAANPRVCFAVQRNVQLVTNDSDPCKWTFSYESAIGYGRVAELLEPQERTHGLDQIMQHYSGRQWRFDASLFAKTRIWRISIQTVTGKHSPPKAT